MKKINNLSIMFAVLLSITSCSALAKYVVFKEDNKDWNTIKINKYTYRIDVDSIMISATMPHAFLSAGPPVIPCFPGFLFFWVKNEDNSLETYVSFNLNKPYTVNLDAIRFVSENKILSPKIEYVTEDSNNKYSFIDYKLMSNGGVFKSAEPARFCFSFKEKTNRTKRLEIHIDPITIDDKSIVLPPLKLKQKWKFEYNPLIL